MVTVLALGLDPDFADYRSMPGLLAYRVFDPTKAPLLSKRALDLTPQIARRAYELYEQRGRREGLAGQDWLEAEREIRTHQAGYRKAS